LSNCSSVIVCLANVAFSC